MPMLSVIKQKAKKYIKDSLNFIENEIETLDDSSRISNIDTYRYNQIVRQHNQSIQPNIPRSYSVIDIYQTPVFQPNQYPRINSSINISQPNILPYLDNSVIRHDNSNVQLRLTRNDETLARRLQEQFNNEFRSQERNSFRNSEANQSRTFNNYSQTINRQVPRSNQPLLVRRNMRNRPGTAININQDRQTARSNQISNNNQNLRVQSGLIENSCLNNQEIELLPSFRYRGNNLNQEENQCSICYEEYTRGVQLTCLMCLHKYHSACIINWLKQSRKCPLCNKDALHGN